MRVTQNGSYLKFVIYNIYKKKHCSVLALRSSSGSLYQFCDFNDLHSLKLKVAVHLLSK